VEWARLILSPPIARRALKYAVVVGTVLILINHGDSILAGDVGRTEAVKMVLTVAVPYFVSAFSSIGTIREARATMVTRK